jgi:excisionase family DNA binding protein
MPFMTTERPQLSYSTAEVAQRLGVSAPTVQRWVDQGHLKAWKTLGGHRRIDAASVDQLIASQAVPAAAVSVGVGAAGPSVLIVDDNPDDRDLLSAMVEQALPGATIRLAQNGFEALVAIGRALPDLLVTDIVMPHMDGVEMLRHLASAVDSTPHAIVVVTSQPPARLGAVAEIVPGAPIVPKPVESEVFAAALRAAAAGGH